MMPQFDICSFFNQVTLTLLFFSFIYAFMDFAFLPCIVTNLKTRDILNFYFDYVKSLEKTIITKHSINFEMLLSNIKP